MLDYKMTPVNLAPAWRPGLGAPVAVRPPVLGVGDQKASAAILGAGIPAIAFGTALSAGTAWVGFSTGSREEGLLSIIGYVVGSIGALTAVGGMASILLLGMAALSGKLQAAPAPEAPVPPPADKTGPWVTTNYA